MAGKGDGKGEGSSKLDGQIACIKYTLFCFNIMSWVGGLDDGGIGGFQCRIRVRGGGFRRNRE